MSKKNILIILFILFPLVGHAQTEGDVWKGFEIAVGHNLRKEIGYYVTPTFFLGSSIAISEQGDVSFRCSNSSLNGK